MILVYVVCRDRDEARAISRAVLERRLAACTNMYPIESMYWWEDSLEDDNEYVLLIKTVDEHFPALSEHIRGMHSYKVPAIIRLPVLGVDSRYLSWLEAETRSR